MKTLRMLLVLCVSGSICLSQPASFSPRGIGGGGALFFPTINPDNDDEFYVACDMSEMFHSDDFGLSYYQVPFTTLQVSGVSTYEFTSSPDTAYCLHNDGNNAYPVRSIDGGASFQQLVAFDVSTYGSATRLYANYQKPRQLIVGAYGDILFSDDGGSTFDLVKHATNMGAGIVVGGVFWDNDDIYIGTNEGLIHSSNGGVSFNTLSTTGIPVNEVIWSFAAGKSGSNIRFVCITANGVDFGNGMKTGTIITPGIIDFDVRSNKIYPTASSRDFIFESDDPHLDLNIYDVTGKLIVTVIPNGTSTIIDAGDWQQGIYFARYGKEVYRLVRQ